MSVGLGAALPDLNPQPLPGQRNDDMPTQRNSLHLDC